MVEKLHSISPLCSTATMTDSAHPLMKKSDGHPEYDLLNRSMNFTDDVKC